MDTALLKDILLAVHLIGLMLGAGGGFGSMVTVRYGATLPAEQLGVIKGLTPILARVALTGLVLMLATGIAMIVLVYGGGGGLGPTFMAKMVFVTTLALAALATEITYGQIKRGNLKAAARLPVLGPIAGISSLLAVILAVLTFH
ncbi:MAG TPA: hypothetical protein VG942_10510 [Hyphomonadaceae bacterium]|nr:hypothetical protein [Hyphomonadaceae bacterium]